MTIQPGDPNGIADHNNLRAAAAAAAAKAGITVTLPPVRALGDPGHVDDHNLLTQALADIAAATSSGPAWAVVSGGTVTEYTHPVYGVMEVHTFTANGTLTVSTPGQADVLMVAGGGGLYTPATMFGGGRALEARIDLPGGSLPVVVGPGGTGGSDPGACTGRASSVGARTTYMGAWNIGAGVASIVNWPGDAAAGLPSTITGTSDDYGRAGQASPRANRGDGSSGGNGSAGIVIIAVKKP